MASFGPIQRPKSLTTKPSPLSSQKDSSMASPQKTHHHQHYGIHFCWPFSIPQSPEAAAVRIVKNLVSCGLYYLLFVYVVLFIALIPARKVSLVCLAGIKEIAFLYLLLLLLLLLLRALPVPLVAGLERIVHRSFVLFLFAVAAALAVILTDGGKHLVITLASTAPAVFVHAALWREDLGFADGEEGGAAGEFVPIMQNKIVDDDDAAPPPPADASPNLVHVV